MICNVMTVKSVNKKLDKPDVWIEIPQYHVILLLLLEEKKTFKALCKSVIKTGLGDALVSVACSGNWVKLPDITLEHLFPSDSQG